MRGSGPKPATSVAAESRSPPCADRSGTVTLASAGAVAEPSGRGRGPPEKPASCAPGSLGISTDRAGSRPAMTRSACGAARAAAGGGGSSVRAIAASAFFARSRRRLKSFGKARHFGDGPRRGKDRRLRQLQRARALVPRRRRNKRQRFRPNRLQLHGQRSDTGPRVQIGRRRQFRRRTRCPARRRSDKGLHRFGRPAAAARMLGSGTGFGSSIFGSGTRISCGAAAVSFGPATIC